MDGWKEIYARKLKGGEITLGKVVGSISALVYDLNNVLKKTGVHNKEAECLDNSITFPDKKFIFKIDADKNELTFREEKRDNAKRATIMFVNGYYRLIQHDENGNAYDPEDFLELDVNIIDCMLKRFIMD